MEHSALHAAQLLGALIAFAAPLLALIALLPARDAAALNSSSGFLADAIGLEAARWAAAAAALAGIATLLNLAVQVAEIEGKTIFGGADPATVWRFASHTTVGLLALVRACLEIAAAVLAWWLSRAPERIRGRGPWLVLAALSLAAIVATAFVSHAAAHPEKRQLLLVLQVTHLVAAAAWVGVLTLLLAARSAIRSATRPSELRLVAAIVARFTPLALTAAVLLLLTGGLNAWTYLGTPRAVLTSAYGLTLAVKLLLLGLLVAAGFVNFRIVRPALDRLSSEASPADADDPRAEGQRATALAQLVRMLEIEVTAGVLVIAVAGVVGSVSPPLGPGEGELTVKQTQAVMSLHLPRTEVPDPALFVGKPTRTDEDLRYSEFMHSWSGVLVALLGLAWLLQAHGGRVGDAAGLFWPLLLVPFAIFVAIGSDPEVWPIGTVSQWQALTDPMVLEHRIGALMIIALAVLGYREARRGGHDRPLGRFLPALMIVGSLLLLGHAHSSFASFADLDTLINVQHAVLGGLGLLAGVIRWLDLRGLFPHRAARVLWPGLVILLGLFMAFSYRELV